MPRRKASIHEPKTIMEQLKPLQLTPKQLRGLFEILKGFVDDSQEG